MGQLCLGESVTSSSLTLAFQELFRTLYLSE
jgi:hypothetical protein